MQEFSVEYSFHGFKKTGTENYGEHLSLKLILDTNWYGFTLVNHNNQQPFLKKLYHQPITKEDTNQIIALLMGKMMDRIEWIIQAINNKQNLNS